VNPPKTVAEIDLNAIAHNLSVVREKTNNRDIIAVVKANAYGHGLVEISRFFAENGIHMLGVAYSEEGILLRESGIKIPILIFFDRDNADICVRYKLTPVVYDFDMAKEVSEVAGKNGHRIPIHIKVDTGMGRVGIPVARAEDEIVKIAGLENIILEGLMSHFSDADLQDKEFANYQIMLFKTLINKLKEQGISFRYYHMANSAAVLTLTDAHFNLVRPGLMLYGYGCCEQEKLRPIMRLKSKIIFLKKVPPGTTISYGRTFTTRRESLIATIPAGYADGFNRLLSNTGKVLINGQFAPVVGRVCMDTFMVDVTDIKGVDYNSDVILIGEAGDKRITAYEIAEMTQTIPYEVLTSVGQRVERRYVK